MNERPAYNFSGHYCESRLLRVGAGDGTLARNIRLPQGGSVFVSEDLALNVERPGSHKICNEFCSES